MGEKWAAMQPSLDAMLAHAAAAQRLAAVLAAQEREGRVTLGGAIWMVQAIRCR